MDKLEPKFRRPGKVGHCWPGVWKASPSTRDDRLSDKKRLWHFNCPAPLCFYQGSYADEVMARKIQETHPCPWYGGGKTTISRGMMSDMFLAPIWKMLDETVDELMEENREDLAARARALADALAVLMPPFFYTGDEVAHEAMVRHQKRQAGEEYETPGIGRLRFAVPPGAQELTPSGLSHASVAGTKHAPEYHPAEASKNFGLPEERVAEIVKSLKAGFPTRMLAEAYGVNEALIKSIGRAHASS